MVVSIRRGLDTRQRIRHAYLSSDGCPGFLYYNSDGFFAGVVSLRAGVTYIFVLLENSADTTHVQYVMYPPGPFIFSPGLNGAWVAPGITKQGILMEVLPKSGTLFLAHFTFQDQVPVALAKSSQSMVQSSGGSDAGFQLRERFYRRHHL